MLCKATIASWDPGTDGDRLRLAMESAQDAVWDWNLPGKTTYFSPRLAEMLGYGPDEPGLTHDRWREQMHPDDRDEVRERLRAHLHGEVPRYQAEFRVRNAQGQWRWLRSRGRVVQRDAQGRAVRMVGTYSDVTEQHQAEEEVLNQLRFIEELLEIIPNPVYFKDRLGRYIGCNRACEDLLGLRREDFLGRTVGEFEPLETAGEEERRDSELYAEGGVQTYDAHVVQPSGEVRDVVCSKTLFTGGQGDVGGILGVITDITRQKRVEAELREASHQAEAASRAKSEFLANMSHEIRTPMSGIIGLIDLTLGAPLGEQERRFLSLAKSSAHSLLNVLNDILDLSRVEAGRMSLEQLAFQPRNLLAEVVASLEPRARAKGLALDCRIAREAPTQMVSDPLRLRQIFVNLLGNAVKFTREGRIDVSVWPEGEGGARALHVCVSDTGIGIAADKLERVFESFTQADNSTTREFGGTGLGLTISRRLAQALGGRLWAESEYGKGSQFHLSLPLLTLDGGAGASPCDEADVPWRFVDSSESAVGLRDKARSRFESTAYRGYAELQDGAEDNSVAGLKVLLADDHAINRFIATTQIRRMGHRVVCAVTAAEALALCEAEDFDLIFLDSHLSGESCALLTHRIRALQAARQWHCPIVALSSHAMPLDRARCMEAGTDDYLAKPIEEDRLEGVLRLVATMRKAVVPSR